MIKDIDYYFDPNSWVLPEYVAGKIKNSNLKIVANYLNPGNDRILWGYGYFEARQYLGIIHNGTLEKVNIETNNLFKVIQYSGITERGILKGTYKLSKIKGKMFDIYRIIPEDSRENLLKSEISEIYRNPGINFTHKMIPGHIYLSKSGDLFLCIINKLEYYGEVSWYRLGLFDSPQKMKILLRITPELKYRIDKISPKTFQEFIKKVYIKRINFEYRSFNFSGKDLGKIFDLGEAIDYFISPDNISKAPTFALLSNELWKTNDLVKKELIKRISEYQSSSCYLSLSFSKLKNELGLL